MYELILVSKSPRRVFLLQKKGYVFRQLSLEVSEILDKNLNLNQQIVDLARQKSRQGEKVLNPLEIQNKIILAADTVVVLDEKIIGKPKNVSHACETLRLMSGRTHTVITGYWLCNKQEGQELGGFDRSEVTFKSLSDEEITSYVASGDPMDKAGSYGIQGEGRNFVESYTGSFENIMGLPVQKIEEEFGKYGWKIRRQL